jgi:hypothetical protein
LLEGISSLTIYLTETEEIAIASNYGMKISFSKKLKTIIFNTFRNKNIEWIHLDFSLLERVAFKLHTRNQNTITTRNDTSVVILYRGRTPTIEEKKSHIESLNKLLSLKLELPG